MMQWSLIFSTRLITGPKGKLPNQKPMTLFPSHRDVCSKSHGWIWPPCQLANVAVQPPNHFPFQSPPHIHLPSHLSFSKKYLSSVSWWIMSLRVEVDSQKHPGWPEIHARQLILKKTWREEKFLENWGWFFPILISNPYTSLSSYIPPPPPPHTHKKRSLQGFPPHKTTYSICFVLNNLQLHAFVCKWFKTTSFPSAKWQNLFFFIFKFVSLGSCCSLVLGTTFYIFLRLFSQKG